MSDYIDPGQKADPAVITAAGLDGIAAGATESIADEIIQGVKQQLSATPCGRLAHRTQATRDSHVTPSARSHSR